MRELGHERVDPRLQLLPALAGESHRPEEVAGVELRLELLDAHDRLRSSAWLADRRHERGFRMHVVEEADRGDALVDDDGAVAPVVHEGRHLLAGSQVGQRRLSSSHLPALPTIPGPVSATIPPAGP